MVFQEINNPEIAGELDFDQIILEAKEMYQMYPPKSYFEDV